MAEPRLVGGLSLSDRIRAIPFSADAKAVAAELGTSQANVLTARRRATNPGMERARNNARQRVKRAEDAEDRKWRWATAYAASFETAEAEPVE